MTYTDRPSPAYGVGPSLGDRVRTAAVWGRDTLDQGGRPLWLAVMIVGFVAAPPLGFAILFYMLWSRRMFGHCRDRQSFRQERWDRRARWSETTQRRTGSSGNTAFDAYREETLKRLEDEHEQFLSFLGRLREARDKAEFDQFMNERREPKAPKSEPQA